MVLDGIAHRGHSRIEGTDIGTIGWIVDVDVSAGEAVLGIQVVVALVDELISKLVGTRIESVARRVEAVSAAGIRFRKLGDHRLDRGVGNEIAQRLKRY